MPIVKVAYVAKVPGHHNSKGELAEWCVKSHEDDHIISSHKSEAAAKSHLQDMHAHSGSKKASISLDNFTRAYIEAALWSSDDDEGQTLDGRYDIDDIAPSTLEAMIEDCNQFQQQNAEAISEKGDLQGGHDFWFTRNGQGAGFWDGDWPINGRNLTLASKKYGEADLYVGDDGYIYQRGKEIDVPVPPREGYNPTEKELLDLKAMGIRGSKKSSIDTDKALMKEMGIVANVKSGLLRKKEPKMAFGFERNQQRQYDYEANGNDVVLISPDNATKLLQGDEANSFWVGLDHIENQTAEGGEQEEHLQRVQSLIRSYFDRDLKAASAKVAVQVDASRLRKSASATFIAGVVMASDGSVEKLKFTTKKAKAEMFSRTSAAELLAQLKDFKLTGKVC